MLGNAAYGAVGKLITAAGLELPFFELLPGFGELGCQAGVLFGEIAGQVEFALKVLYAGLEFGDALIGGAAFRMAEEFFHAHFDFVLHVGGQI